MNRTLATLGAVVVLVLAGCSGGGSGTTAEPTATPQPTTGGNASTPTTVESGQPYVTDGTLNLKLLLRAHLQTLRQADSYTITGNTTGVYAANGSSTGRATSRYRIDLADETAALTSRSYAADGTLTQSRTSYRNATHRCSIRDGSVECQEATFDERRIVGLAIETTSLETVGGPAFERDGTVTRDGQELSRYSATTLRSGLSESVAAKLGTNPSLGEATLLVHPSGRIVEYRITYTAGETGQRTRLTQVYTTQAVNATTVPDPETFVSE